MTRRDAKRERDFPGTEFIKNENSFDFELLLLALIKNVHGSKTNLSRALVLNTGSLDGKIITIH